MSGGAGTYAFLVGCGAFDAEGGFVTRQFVLLRHADERQLLQMVGAELAPAGALVSFNGKSFDAPLIETRHLFHRLEWTGSRLPHLDVLHPARRFWSDGAAGDTPCSLVALERSVLGARRSGDVPGSEIPARYFQFVRSGDARPLVARAGTQPPRLVVAGRADGAITRSCPDGTRRRPARSRGAGTGAGVRTVRPRRRARARLTSALSPAAMSAAARWPPRPQWPR